MNTVFAQPQYKLIPDPEGARHYANVDNAMHVTLADSHYSFKVAVVVPTGMFTLMKEAFKIPVGSKMYLAIDEFKEDKRNSTSTFLFSLQDDERLYDLWAYTEKTLPSWIMDEKYRL